MYRNCNTSTCSTGYLMEEMWSGLPLSYGLNKTHQFFTNGNILNWSREFGIQANVDKGI
jgi:hypothetical protein